MMPFVVQRYGSYVFNGPALYVWSAAHSTVEPTTVTCNFRSVSWLSGGTRNYDADKKHQHTSQCFGFERFTAWFKDLMS
jgi:hypothetical protein